MGVIVKELKRSSKSHAFYDGDLKRMERSGFRAKGWMKYSDSPYKDYERRVRQYGDHNTTDREDSRGNV